MAFSLYLARPIRIRSLSCPLIEFNEHWARHAAALIYLLLRKDFTGPGKTEPQFSRTYSFDSGAARNGRRLGGTCTWHEWI